MNVQHINIKFFIENPEALDPADYGAVFNSWIQGQRLDGLLIDVADYLHVHNGPGILLIGHEADYSLDNRAGRLGLLYNRKAQLEGTLQEKLAQAVRAALTAIQILQNEHGVKINTQEVQLIVNDRLLVPNTAETFAALEPDLKAFFDRLYSGEEFSLAHHNDPRERFTVHVKTASTLDIERLLKNLAVETVHV
ncbi:MAG TPA: hypothetical protein VK900_10755 [Anaerolineales bacterium]|nr:hypothetical protein [Anaerolineales bacterium]